MGRWLAILLAACGNTYNGPEPHQPEVPGPQSTDIAVQAARLDWGNQLGVELSEETPAVRWFTGLFLTYPNYDAWLAGAYFPNTNEIHLVYQTEPSSGAFAHEMLHWALSSTGQPGDINHEGPLWAEVSGVTRRLQQEGL